MPFVQPPPPEGQAPTLRTSDKYAQYLYENKYTHGCVSFETNTLQINRKFLRNGKYLATL
jgi:hypothetical protein